MSEVLDKVREKYSEYKDVPDSELALRIGTKFPAYLDRDPKFKEEFQGVVADRAISAAQKGVTYLLDVLGNPAAGEAAQAGRDDIAFQKSIGQEGQPPAGALERASKNWQEAGMATAPSRRPGQPIDVGGTTITPGVGAQLPTFQPPPEAGAVEKVAAGLWNTGASIPNFMLSTEGIATMLAPETISPKLAEPLLKGLFAGLMAKGAGEAAGKASVTKDPQDITEFLGAAVMAGHLGYSGAIDTINERRADNGKSPVTGPIKGLIKTLIGKVKAKPQDSVAPPAETAKIAESAPLTAKAIEAQPAILESAKPAVEVAKTPQDKLGSIQTPPEASKPATESPVKPVEASGDIPTVSDTTKPVPQSEMPKTPSQTGFYPAIRLIGGDVLVGEAGTTHPDIIDEYNLDAKSIDQRGFVDSEGVFHDREQTAAKTGVPTDTEAGRQHSTDLPEAKQGEENALHKQAEGTVRDVQQSGGSEKGPSEVPAAETGQKTGEGGGEVPQQAPELKSAEAAKPKGKAGRPKEDRVPDIIDWIQATYPKGIKITSKADYAQLLQDKKGAARKVLFMDKADAEPIDKVLQTSEMRSKFPYQSEDELVNAVIDAGSAREGKRQTVKKEEALSAKGEAETQAFEDLALHNKGRNAVQKRAAKAVAVEDLKQGSTFSLKGEKFTVKEITPDGDVVVTSKKFGEQPLRDGETFYPDKGEVTHPPEEDSGFWPEEAVAGAEPISPEKTAVVSLKDGQAEISRDQALAINGGRKNLLPKPGETKTQPSDPTGEYLIGQTSDGRFFTEHKPKPTTPKLGAMEKGTGDLLKGQSEDFALTGEKGSDVERIAAAKEKAKKDAAEAKAIEEKQQLDMLKAPIEKQQEMAKTAVPPGKFMLRGQGPQLYTMVERLPATDIEIANGEQVVRVKNVKTGDISDVMEGQLQQIRERNPEEKAKGKGMTKRELDDELRRVGLDPSSFTNAKEKRAALKRERLKGPGSPSLHQGPDPKPQIQQLEESFRGIKGRNVSLSERVRAAFTLGDKLSTAKDAVSRSISALKLAGDYLTERWRGDTLMDDLLKGKGDLSAELEIRGWTTRQFAKRVKAAIPDVKQRAAIAKWIDAGGRAGELLWGANHTKPEYRQAYVDAMHLSGDLLVAAQNLQNYFESRLQDAIDAGVLESGIEDYIHRIYEKDPLAANQMIGYVQSGLLSKNPSLAKKRIFQMDWEAERQGYKPVQDFLPRITAYETSLSKAIAAREFIKKVIGFTDENGAKIKGMVAPDGRPIVDVAGLGTPIEDQSGVREGTLINPSFKPHDTKNPKNERGDYKERPEFSALRKWKWVIEDEAGKPIYVQGNVVVHPNYVGRIDALLKPSSIRNALNPKARGVFRAALGVSSTVKQTMLDFSGFHQVQIAVHGMEHRVNPFNLSKEIDFDNEDVQGLMKGGVTLGGDYHESHVGEGLIGRSISRLIPGIAPLMDTYHSYLFQDFIPRMKMTMAMHALERNKARFPNMGKDELYHLTANQANAAFGGLNPVMLERGKTAQDLSRLILLAPDFLEARGRFATQAFTKHGTEQRQALLLGALTMYAVARVANQIIDGQPHMEPENMFSIVHNGKAYGLRTVQGDILHLIENPIQFWMSRLNPVFGRTMLELATGRDYFGRKRSPLEQLYDGVSTMMPVSLRTSSERKLWESLLNGMGITARRYSDTDQVFKLAQKWKDKHGVGMKGEFIYDSDKDPLRPLKLALSNSDDGGAVKSIKRLIESKKYTISKLSDYFTKYANMPFTGSQENDRKFLSELSDDNKKTFQAAREHKRAMLRLYHQALGHWRAAQNPESAVEEPPKSQDVPIPQLEPQRLE